MERLVEVTPGIDDVNISLDKDEEIQCGDWCNKCGKADCKWVQRALKRLAQYEATGLTPQEIMDGKLLTGWIPVGERLPGLYETVLVTAIGIEDEESLVYEGARQGNDKWELCGVGNPDYYKVLAWMPLPETYKGE